MAKSQWSIHNIPDQKGRVVVITGATSGIGKETARVLAKKNATVTIAVRNVAKGEDVADEIRRDNPAADITVRELDLANLRSVNTLAQSLMQDFGRLDILINNAGIMMCPYAKTGDGFEIQFGTNHLGHFALAGQLLPLLKNTGGSRMVVVSSLAHKRGNVDFSDPHWEQRKYNTSQAYCDSKVANLQFAYELSRRLEEQGKGPLVTAAHPGWTGTDLQRHSGMLSFLNRLFGQSVEAGALPTLRAATDPDAKPGDYFGPSKFFEMHGPPARVESTPHAKNADHARTLWAVSEELTGLVFKV